MGPGAEDDEPTRWQRRILSTLRKEAGREEGEPLEPEDWAIAWRMHSSRAGSAMSRMLAALPSSPRCSVCGAPFAGIGGRLAGPLGYRPSRKNPAVCGVCVEYSPPGGVTLEIGVLFADLRGFTARSEKISPREVSTILRRFYRAAEDVLFPDAVIDKLIGDEVMALYISDFSRTVARRGAPEVMLEHAAKLLGAVGYGSADGPFVDLGIGIDYGEAFVGNIGQRNLYDFTAVGDVVNTASRLQGNAAAGEIVFSNRVAAGLEKPVGVPVELHLKGKSEPQAAFRIGR